MSTHVKDNRIRPVIFLIVLFAVPNLLFLITYGMGKITGVKWMTAKHAVVKTEAILIILDINILEKQKGPTLDLFEKDLIKRLDISKAGELGGKICKEEKCTFSVLGSETDRLYQVIKPALKTLPASSGYLEIIYDLKNSNERIKRDLY